MNLAVITAKFGIKLAVITANFGINLAVSKKVIIFAPTTINSYSYDTTHFNR